MRNWWRANWRIMLEYAVLALIVALAVYFSADVKFVSALIGGDSGFVLLFFA
jgi:hypothetical protein